MNYRQQLSEFDESNMPDLDVAVLGALELFADTELPQIDQAQYRRPLVVGSGNAEVTGRILFADTDAVFASESDYQRKLETVSVIDGVVIISASGSKHASRIASEVAGGSLPVMLITSTVNSPAERALAGTDTTVVVLPRNREPYTYNTSTYLGMILAASGEDPAGIKNFIESTVSELDFDVLGRHDKFYLIVPPHFGLITRMIEVKFIELFGRNIARDVETSEYVAHATTVASADEVFISFGEENTTWGDPSKRLHVPLPNDGGYGAMMAIGYYVVAQIQKRQPDFFKQNIVEYTQRVSDIFDNDIQPIVPGTNN